MTSTTFTEIQSKPQADLWFAKGERVDYNFLKKEIITGPTNLKNNDQTLGVWHNIKNQFTDAEKSEWMTMMPGFPDGSFGWAATEEYLMQMDSGPRLYLDYVGMGDSDKPDAYNYSVLERADLIEAFWRYYRVKETALVTFDFSSLVALELLSRQIDKVRRGIELGTVITKVLMINGGLFADSHSHPILTTPLLKTYFGRLGTQMAQRSQLVFNIMMKDLWSKAYGITQAELVENFNAITRRNGALFMSNAAGFVDEHQEYALRWDLKRVFEATSSTVKYIVAGSELDQFEPKQVLKAKRELEYRGLQIRMFPGGHMTTSEHPDLIAKTIAELKEL